MSTAKEPGPDRDEDDGTRVERQRAALLRLADPERGRALLDWLAEHRQVETVEPEDLPRPLVRPAVELVDPPDGDGEPVPVAAGRVLVPGRVDQETAERTAALLRGLGWSPTDEAPGVVVWRASDRAASVAKTLAAAREEGLPVTADHVVMHSTRMKGSVTPEHADHPPEPLGHVVRDDDAPLVVVVDTGLDAAAADRGDGWLDDVVVAPGDVDPLDVLDRDLRPLAPGAPRDGLDLGAGHGTFVAGVVRQVAPHSRVVALRALATDGTGTESDLALAIRRAAELFGRRGGGRGVLVLALGYKTVDDRAPVVLEAALAELADGVAVVAAAGNTGSTRPTWPAASKRVVAVAATDRSGRLAPWSDRGHWVDLATDGEGVVSTFVAGDETPGRGPHDPFDDHPESFPRPHQHEAYALWSGTSFAAPAVGGWLAARLAADPSASPARAVAALRARGRLVDGVWAVRVERAAPGPRSRRPLLERLRRRLPGLPSRR